jgi:hypothetical protein
VKAAGRGRLTGHPRRLVAAALGPLLAAACGSPTYTVIGAGARSPPPAPPLGPVVVRALHLADFGEQNAQQATVARAVAAAHARAPFDVALFPGDNLYEDGPDPAVPGADGCRFAADGNTLAPGFTAPPDPTFARHEAPLAPLAGVPVYLALGNHDVLAPPGASATVGRRRACLEVAHSSPAWRMPARHYVVDVEEAGSPRRRGEGAARATGDEAGSPRRRGEGAAGAPGVAARFIVVDSNLVKGDYGGFSFEDEVAFVAQAAAGCEGRACFLVGHHPPVTAGEHAADATPAYLARMGRLVAAGGGRIRAWLAGHDHDLQHLRTPAGLDVLVSGNGSRGRPLERFAAVSVPGATLEFASVRWGYGVLSVTESGWTYRFEDVEGAPLHCCAALGAGPCAPVQCGP